MSIEHFTPMIKQQPLKEKIVKLSNKALSLGDAELSNKIGAINGLYSAYELAPSEALLEKISIYFAEIVETLLDEGTVPTITTETKQYIDIYERYKSFLIDNGRSIKTVDIYVRALKRILKNKNENVSPELSYKIAEVREIVESPSLDIKNEDSLIRISKILREIIVIKEIDEVERERSKKDHGIGISALKQFLNFILLSHKRVISENENKN